MRCPWRSAPPRRRRETASPAIADIGGRRRGSGGGAGGGNQGAGGGISGEGIDAGMDHYRTECGSFPTNRDVYGSLTEVSQLTVVAQTRRLHRLHRPGAAGTVDLGAAAPDGST